MGDRWLPKPTKNKLTWQDTSSWAVIIFIENLLKFLTKMLTFVHLSVPVMQTHGHGCL